MYMYNISSCSHNHLCLSYSNHFNNCNVYIYNMYIVPSNRLQIQITIFHGSSSSVKDPGVMVYLVSMGSAKTLCACSHYYCLPLAADTMRFSLWKPKRRNFIDRHTKGRQPLCSNQKSWNTEPFKARPFLFYLLWISSTSRSRYDKNGPVRKCQCMINLMSWWSRQL